MAVPCAPWHHDLREYLTWARQAQFRVVYHPNNNWAVGVSLENPQQFAPGSVVYPSSFFTSQFDNGSGSTSAASSATNTAVPNLHPDIIVKAAYDGEPGGHASPVPRLPPRPPRSVAEPLRPQVLA